MSTIATGTAVEIPRFDAADSGDLRVTQARVVRSEWMKMRTLRSSWLTMALAIVSVPGIGVAIAWSTAHDWANMRVRENAHFNPLADPMSGFNLAQLGVECSASC